VVENDEHLIVGTWSILPLVHTEGLGVAPAYQGKVGVLRMLLREGRRAMRRMGISSFVTGAASEEMANYLGRMGGSEIPVRFFLMPLEGQMARVTKE
jgi:hypothetical protein